MERFAFFNVRQPQATIRPIAWVFIMLLASLLSQRAAGESATTQILMEFRTRRSAVPSSDIPARLALATWAIDQGLTDEAQTLYRQALIRDPGNDQAYDALVELSAKQPMETVSEVYAETLALLPKSFRVYETQRYLIISNADAKWTRRQAELLERAYHQFMRFCRSMNLRPQPLRHKLVCVLFDSRNQYRAFAGKHDGVVDTWISGYYSPENDRIVFYQVEANPSLEKARVKLQEMANHLQQLQKQVSLAERAGRHDHADVLRDNLAQYRTHYKEQTRRIDAFAEQVSASTTVHEATHQLFFHTRVQSPSVHYPLWISEGLAVAFETDNPRRAFGPDREYAPRRQPFDQMLNNNGLIPLRQLVTYTQMPDNEAKTVHAVYHQSYALVTWLARHRRDAFQKYLATMLNQPGGRIPADRQLELFEASFGNINSLERTWQKDERVRLSRARKGEGANSEGSVVMTSAQAAAAE